MTPARIVAEALAVSLGKRPVLRGLSLAAEPGALTVVMGPNGAGKTTLLRTVAGLLPPTSGAVRLGTSRLADLSAEARARSIAYLPQAGGIGWPIPLAQLVALGRLPHGEAPGRLSRRGAHAVAAAIAAVGLEELAGRPATELSGGERARALLARALAVEAPVLLADEPVAALDPRHQLLAMEVLRARAHAGATVLAVMHDLALAARFADAVVLIDAGLVRSSGRPQAVLTAAAIAASFGIEATVEERDGALTVTPWRALAG